MHPPPRHPFRAIITALALTAVIAGIAACGGSESSAEDEAASSEDAGLEFAQCMRENGVDVPDPEPGQEGFGFQIGDGSGIDPSSDEFQEASEECGSILEDAIPEGERPDPAEIEDELYELTQCLRDKGLDVPEPRIAAIGSGEAPEAPDPDEMERMEELQEDPEYQQAQEDCADETGVDLPGGPGGPADEG